MCNLIGQKPMFYQDINHRKRGDVIRIVEHDYNVLGQQKNIYQYLFCNHSHKNFPFAHTEQF